MSNTGKRANKQTKTSTWPPRCRSELSIMWNVMSMQEKWDHMTRRWRENISVVQLTRLFLIDEVRYWFSQYTNWWFAFCGCFLVILI